MTEGNEVLLPVIGCTATFNLIILLAKDGKYVIKWK